MTPFTQEQWKLIQGLSLLAYVHRGEESKDLYQAVVAAKVMKSLYDYIKKDNKADKAREEAILAIAQFVKTHPRASEKEIQKEVEKQIALFVEKIQ